MDFRKDELYVELDNSDSNSYEDCAEIKEKKKEQSTWENVGIEQAYELVENAENKLNDIGIVLRGIDKRISFNHRLMASVTATMPPEDAGDALFQ